MTMVLSVRNIQRTEYRKQTTDDKGQTVFWPLTSVIWHLLTNLILTGDITGQHFIHLAGAGDIEQDGPFASGQPWA